MPKDRRHMSSEPVAAKSLAHSISQVAKRCARSRICVSASRKLWALHRRR